MPTDEIQLVEQALNTFITWPKILVKIISSMDFDESRKKNEPKRLQVKVDLIQCLWKVANKVGRNLVQLELDAEKTSRNSTIPLYLC
ncbi:hypothetical protein CR513_58632, partial [Mucuna pruriens]